MPSVSKSIRALLTAILCLCMMPLPAFSADSDSLTFLHYWTGALNGGIDETAEAFNRGNPEFTVRATGFDHEAFKVSINVMLAGGTPPDIFSYWAGAKVESLVNQNYLASIDQVWTQSNLNTVFPPPMAEACTYHGQRYAIPLTQHYVAFFYNKKIFTTHNITPPTNWEEFIGVCDTLKQAGVTPIALGSRERWPAQFWFDYLLLRTAGPVYRHKLMNGLASYNDPEVKKVFSLWKSLLDADYFHGSPNVLDWAEAAQVVHADKAAMTLMGTWAIGLFDNQLGWQQDIDYDFFSFPIMDPKIPLTALGPLDVLVVSREGRPADVNSVLAYFSDPGPQMEMSRGSGALAPSQTIPISFYTPLQRRIISDIRKAPHWAFNYDLATPPEVAEHGLNAFKQFIDNPSMCNAIRQRLTTQSEAYFNTH